MRAAVIEIAYAAPMAELEHCKKLLRQVYAQCGNHRPAEYRHALPPGLRDLIRDTIKWQVPNNEVAT